MTEPNEPMPPQNPWRLPRYHPPGEPPTQRLPAAPRHSPRPTTPRPLPSRYCFQCGAALPAWRDACFAHDRRHGRGLPPPPRLLPVAPSVVDRATIELPASRGHPQSRAWRP